MTEVRRVRRLSSYHALGMFMIECELHMNYVFAFATTIMYGIMCRGDYVP